MSEKKDTSTDKKISRRSMLKWTGALAAAAVVTAVAGYEVYQFLNPPLSFKPPLSASVQARRDAIVQNLIARHQGETVGYWGAGTMGGDLVDVTKLRIKDGIVTTTEPDDTINPNTTIEDADPNLILTGMIKNRGYARNYAGRKSWYSAYRVIYPMKRTSTPRGTLDGKFVRISWEEALNTVATQMATMKDKYGPYSIAYNPVAAWQGCGVVSWGVASWESHTFATTRCLGSSSSTVLPSHFNAKLIVFWSVNPSDVGATYVPYYFQLAKEKGIPMINIGPRYGIDAEIQADQWIPIRTSTDTAMALAMANVLIKENLYDKTFVDKFVWDVGFQKWKDYVMGVTDKVEKTPEWAEKITGVPAQTITELARLIAKSTPCLFVTGAGMGRQNQGYTIAWAGQALSALTGNIGKDGTNVCTGSNRPMLGNSLSTPNPSAQYGQKAGTFTAPTTYHAAAYQDAVLLRPQIDSGVMTAAQYRNAVGAATTDPINNLHMAFSPSRYSVNDQPDINRQVKTFQALDFVVATTSDMSPTARTADIILPWTEDGPEMNSGFKGIMAGMMLSAKLVPAQGEAMDRTWMYTELAKRLGFVDKYMPDYTTADKWDALMVSYNQKAYEAWAASASIAPLKPPSWADFVKNPVFRAPWGQPTIGYDAQINKGQKFTTPSGKIEFYSDELGKGVDYLKTTRYGGYVDPMPMYGSDVGPYVVDGFGDTTKPNYPLTCSSSHRRYHLHHRWDLNPLLRDEVYRHSIWLSVADAAARGIKDGDTVLVSNDQGKITVTAYVTSRMVPGCTVVFENAHADVDQSGVDRRGCINMLVSTKRDFAGMFPFCTRVQVAKA